MSVSEELVSSLLSLSNVSNKQSAKQKKKMYIILFWIDTKEFNTVPLTRVPKEHRKEGDIATVKAERKEWKVKLVKVGGK